MNIKYLIAFVSAVALLVASVSSAQPQAQTQSVEQELIKGNIVISEWLDSTAEAIDLFLTGRKLSKKPNETRVRIENSTISNEAEGVINSTSLKVQLRLPNLEEYFQLKFTSYDEQDERSIRSRYLRQGRRRENYGASLGFFKSVGQIKTTFQPRIELRDPLKISHMLGFETLIKMTKSNLNPKIELFADPDKGTGVFNQINLNIEINKRFQLTLINEGEYADKQLPHLDVTNGLVITQALNPKTHLTYNLLFNSNNSVAYHLDSYDVAVGWNQLVYKRILDYQLIPHLNFARSNRYKGQAGVTLNMNLNF